MVYQGLVQVRDLFNGSLDRNRAGKDVLGTIFLEPLLPVGGDVVGVHDGRSGHGDDERQRIKDKSKDGYDKMVKSGAA